MYKKKLFSTVLKPQTLNLKIKIIFATKKKNFNIKKIKI